MSKKRSRGTNNNNGGIFDAVNALDSQDQSADRKKRHATERDVRKSMAAQSQVKLYDHLMEIRILLQRVTSTSTSGDAAAASPEVQDLCQTLLQQLLTARAKLGSASEEEDYDVYQKEWKQVFNQRYKELRLHAGLTAKAQFKLLDSDFWQQVESTTQHELASHKNKGTFDDSKLYQHMLQDFLVGKQKSGNSAETVRNKKKKNNKKNPNVDRKSSKGRKTRYTIIPKLVNFTFPLERPQLVSGMDQDEWFKSLFGGGGKTR